MVKILSALGCLVSAFSGGYILRIAPTNDPVIWLVAFLFGCAFMCFWTELIRD